MTNIVPLPISKKWTHKQWDSLRYVTSSMSYVNHINFNLRNFKQPQANHLTRRDIRVLCVQFVCFYSLNCIKAAGDGDIGPLFQHKTSSHLTTFSSYIEHTENRKKHLRISTQGCCWNRRIIPRDQHTSFALLYLIDADMMSFTNRSSGTKQKNPQTYMWHCLSDDLNLITSFCSASTVLFTIFSHNCPLEKDWD